MITRSCLKGQGFDGTGFSYPAELNLNKGSVCQSVCQFVYWQVFRFAMGFAEGGKGVSDYGHVIYRYDWM